jgi:hypothetical protein
VRLLALVRLPLMWHPAEIRQGRVERKEDTVMPMSSLEIFRIWGSRLVATAKILSHGGANARIHSLFATHLKKFQVSFVPSSKLRGLFSRPIGLEKELNAQGRKKERRHNARANVVERAEEERDIKN